MVAQKSPLKNSKPLLVVANLLIAAGIIGAAGLAYQIWGTNVTSAILAQQERTALQREFSDPTKLTPSLVEPEASKSFALVTIPALKLKDFPLVQGIEESDLMIEKSRADSVLLSHRVGIWASTFSNAALPKNNWFSLVRCLIVSKIPS